MKKVLSSGVFEVAGGHIKSIDECEQALASMGLSAKEIKALGDTIDTIGEIVFDSYLQQFYE